MKITPAVGRLAAEVARAFRNFNYAVTGDGRILIGGSSAQLGGFFRHHGAVDGVNWSPLAIDHNRVVTEGLIDIAKVAFCGGAQTAQFYLAPFGNDIQVQADLTAATFKDTAGEITAYTPTTRVPWAATAPTTTATVSNTASPAQITFTAPPGALRGIGLLTASAKNAVIGKLYAASRFEEDYTGFRAGSKFAAEYIFNLLDEADAP